MKFESEAERIAYPIINSFAIQNKWKLSYQVKVGHKWGGYSTREECYNANGWDYEYWMDDYYGYWEDNSWESELYRIDFVLEKNGIKYAIEIDGEIYHNEDEQKKHDVKRDIFLIKMGYIMIRIPAKEVLYNQKNFKIRLNSLELISFFTEIKSYVKTIPVSTNQTQKKGLEVFFK